MKPRENWICWELSREEIDRAAKRVGVDPGSLREEDYNNIARKFEEQLKKVNKQQWEVILEDAVETMVRL
jgi:hypothetical protein